MISQRVAQKRVSIKHRLRSYGLDVPYEATIPQLVALSREARRRSGCKEIADLLGVDLAERRATELQARLHF